MENEIKESTDQKGISTHEGGLSSSYYTPQAVADLCRVNLSTVNRWIAQDKIKSLKSPGGHHRITKEWLMDFLRIYRYTPPAELGPIMPEILVVDDDAEVLEMIVSALKKKITTPVNIRAFTNPFDALVQAGNTLPDAAIIDVVMKGLDGFHICEAIRKRTGGSTVDLVVITGREEPGHRERAKELEADFFLKPINVTGLAERIARKVGVTPETGNN